MSDERHKVPEKGDIVLRCRGIERSFEKKLRGKPGRMALSVDARRKIRKLQKAGEWG